MASNTSQVRNRRYLAKDFDALKADLLDYARTYYPDRMQDFSESSIGGLLLDMAAYVGDNLSFYLDHQFSELDPQTVFEDINAQRLLRMAGVQITGASPATVMVTFNVQVPGELINDLYEPNSAALPIIRAGTEVSSQSGIIFTLLEDLDFSQKTVFSGVEKYIADVSRVNNDFNNGVTFIMSLIGECSSARVTTQTFQIGNTFTPFMELALDKQNVSEVLSVIDANGNQYYEVNSLSDDVVYKNFTNIGKDSDKIKSSLQLIPAPYRFIKKTDITTKATSLVFGDGMATNVQDNIISNPSNFALPFKNKKTFPRVQLNPQQLINNGSLGTVAINTNITVKYSYGGGSNHNVKAGQITNVNTLVTNFTKNPSRQLVNQVVIECINNNDAFGGADAPTAAQLLAQIPGKKFGQNRIVTRQDLLSRIYTLPTNLGAIYRAAVHDNPNNPLSTLLYIISIDENGFLTTTQDTAKNNISSYIDSFRMISDYIEILDAQIINLAIDYEIMVSRNARENLSVVITNVNKALKQYFSNQNVNIDDPINLDDVKNVIFGVSNVISILNLKFSNRVNVFENRNYNTNYFEVESGTKSGMIIPPTGGIFEIRYPGYDIKGKAS
jgi:hypothetical protein